MDNSCIHVSCRTGKKSPKRQNAPTLNGKLPGYLGRKASGGVALAGVIKQMHKVVVRVIFRLNIVFVIERYTAFRYL